MIKMEVKPPINTPHPVDHPMLDPRLLDAGSDV